MRAVAAAITAARGNQARISVDLCQSAVDAAVKEANEHAGQERAAMQQEINRLKQALASDRLHGLRKERELLDPHVRVLRIIEYAGPRSWVENTVQQAIHGTRVIDAVGSKQITAVTLHGAAELLANARYAPAVEYRPDLQPQTTAQTADRVRRTIGEIDQAIEKMNQVAHSYLKKDTNPA